MEINGYKAFNQDLTNRYGFKFEEGKTYSVDDYPSFGLNGKGFHFCKNIEDTFRYFNPDNCLIASVTGMGEIAEGFDDYNEYYNMFSSNKIRINHVLSREEVLSEILSLNTESRVCRFIATGYSLNDEEIKMFRDRYNNSLIINQYLDFYSCGDKEVFERMYNRKIMKR